MWTAADGTCYEGSGLAAAQRGARTAGTTLNASQPAQNNSASQPAQNNTHKKRCCQIS